MESNQKSVNENIIKTKQMKLEVEKTAILFIEYQNEFLSDGGKLSKDIIEKSSLVANSADLANKAREMGVKIIHVAFFSTADSEDCKSTCKEIDTTQGPLGGIKAAGYFKEDWNIKFIDAMKPKAGDIVMHKHRLDTFQNTNVKEILDKHGIQTLAVAGLLTHACVESTIRSAYDKDYQVVGLVDCTATNIKGYKDFVIKNTWPLFCEPMTKDQFLTSMERQDSEKIEGVNKDVKAKESKSLTLNVGLSDANEVVENTKVTVQEHTIVVDGSELSERKELEFVVDGNSEGQSTIKHTRKIDGQQYTVIEKRENGQFKSTETITMMTPDELTAFKEKWRIMWHPEMTEDEILDLVDQEGHTSGEPEVQTEATPKTQLPQAREESRKEAKPDKKKKVFWCCC